MNQGILIFAKKMKQAGFRVVVPKVIGLDKPFDFLISVPLGGVGCDLKFIPGQESTEFSLLGKEAKKLDDLLDILKEKVVQIQEALKTRRNSRVQIKLSHPIHQVEILPALYEGFWKLEGPDDREKDTVEKALIKKWDLSDWERQIYYTAKQGGVRVSQKPYQQNGFRLNLPEGFRVVLYPKHLNASMDTKKEESASTDTRVMIASLVRASLYSDIPALKFAMSGTTNPTPFNMLTSGANRIDHYPNIDATELSYAVFKNSTEAADFVKELKNAEKERGVTRRITIAEIATEGTRVL